MSADMRRALERLHDVGYPNETSLVFRDDVTGEILFLGRLMEPAAAFELRPVG